MSTEEMKKTGGKKSRKARRRKARKVLLIIEIIILIILLLALFVMLKFGKINFQDIGETITNPISEESKLTLKGYTNIAFFGIDNRSNGNYESGQSDVVMVCSINNDTKEIRVVSVYRDTLMDVDGEGKYRKCNYAYAHEGVTGAINMLNRNLDMDIKDFVAVDFNAVAEAIDAVGGIDLTITDAEINPGGGHPGINAYIDEVADVTGREGGHVKAGEQHVNGVQATAYCRLRYTASMDFGRAARQRVVLQKLFDKVKTANLVELNNLVDAVFDDISTSYSAGDLIALASAVKDYSLAGTAGYPFAKATGEPSKTVGSVVIPCTVESNVKELYKYLFNEEDHQCSSTVEEISQSVVNETGMTEADAVDYDASFEDASGTSVR